jgi:hypothetical protein
MLAISSIGCAGVDRDLYAVSVLYRDARYEAAQAWFGPLSVEYADMTATQRVTYHYLNGMTAYRLSQPQDAEHELALAAHAVVNQATALSPAQLAIMYRTLEELSPVQVSSSAAALERISR